MHRSYKANQYFDFFNNYSQVLLIENWLTGALVFLAILISSPLSAFLSLVAVLTSLLVALKWSSIPSSDISAGLLGYSSVLTAIFISQHYDFWLGIILSMGVGILNVVISYYFGNYFGKKNLPILTLPFILMTWLLVLWSQHSGVDHWTNQTLTSSINYFSLSNFFIGGIKAFGEIFLLDHITASLLILIGILIDQKMRTVKMILSLILSLLVAYIVGADANSLTLGLYSYNTILVVLSLEQLDMLRSGWTWIILTPLATVCLDFMLGYILSLVNLPLLTIPFVIACYLFIFFQKKISKE
ncbi:urea transporter [Aerococcus urinaehominis]|nr:urea transporter [Aerococcus urinaehominis]